MQLIPCIAGLVAAILPGLGKKNILLTLNFKTIIINECVYLFSIEDDQNEEIQR